MKEEEEEIQIETNITEQTVSKITLFYYISNHFAFVSSPRTRTYDNNRILLFISVK